MLGMNILAFFVLAVYVKLNQLRHILFWLGGVQTPDRAMTPAQRTWWYLQCFRDEILTLALLTLGWMALSRLEATSPTARLARFVGWIVLPVLSLYNVMHLGYFKNTLNTFTWDLLPRARFISTFASFSDVVETRSILVGLLLMPALYLLMPWVGWQLIRRRLGTPSDRLLWFTAFAALAGGALLALRPQREIRGDPTVQPMPFLGLVASAVLGSERWVQPVLPGRPLPEWATPAPTHATRPADRRPYNIVLWFVEGFGARFFPAYNPKARCGERLMAYRDQMVLWDPVYSSFPLSSPAAFSLVYGRYPWLWSATWWGMGELRIPSLPGTLRTNDYRTGLLSAADLRFDGQERLFRPDDYDTIEDCQNIFGRDGYASSRWGLDDRVLLDRAKAWIQEEPGRRYFLQLKTVGAHYPYNRPTPEHTKLHAEPRDAQQRFENLLNYDMHLIQEFYEWLLEQGQADDTIVIVVGDHGQSFGKKHLGMVFGFMHLYEENTHVACFWLHPNRAGLPPRIDRVSSLADLAPTVLDIVGISSGTDFDGISMLAQGPRPPVLLYNDWRGGCYGLRHQHWKYIYVPRRDRHELYDLRDPFTERHNQFYDRPDALPRANDALRDLLRLQCRRVEQWMNE